MMAFFFQTLFHFSLLSIYLYLAYFLFALTLTYSIKHYIYLQTRHKNKELDTILEPIRANIMLLFHVKSFVCLLLIYFIWKISLNHLTQPLQTWRETLKYIGFITINKPHSFYITEIILLFNSALLMFVVFYISTEVFTPPWLHHTKHFVSDPKPYDPIFGSLFRGLPEEKKNELAGIFDEKNFIDAMFTSLSLDQSTSPKLPFPPTLWSLFLTKALGYLLLWLNFRLLSMFISALYYHFL